MGNLWSRGVARSHLMGYEKTSNPTPAAASMLGRRRVASAKRKLRRRGRRSAHRGNPLPAVVGLLGSGLLGKLGGRFRASSDSRAAKLAPSIVQAANAGNLTAAAGLIERPDRAGIQKEKAVWRLALAQLAPKIVAAVHKYADLIPHADHSSPENFAASVLGQPVSLPDLEQAERETKAAAQAEARAGRAATAAASERREARLTELGAAGLSALARGGRRPTQRRRRRRSTRGRPFSF